MLLFFVRLRLLIYLGLFTSDLLGIYLHHIRSLLWSLVMLVLLLAGVGHTFVSTANQVQLEQITAVSLSEKVPHQSQTLTRSELETQLAQYKIILLTQPQHKDVLLNIALLQKALHNQRESYLAWEEAQKLDPNNPIFSTEQSKN